ncbi:hypothetical protein CEXT_701081, partial [Caerostris extrusa]
GDPNSGRSQIKGSYRNHIIRNLFDNQNSFPPTIPVDNSVPLFARMSPRWADPILHCQLPSASADPDFVMRCMRRSLGTTATPVAANGDCLNLDVCRALKDIAAYWICSLLRHRG